MQKLTFPFPNPALILNHLILYVFQTSFPNPTFQPLEAAQPAPENYNARSEYVPASKTAEYDTA
jgi:hypothetical protein